MYFEAHNWTTSVNLKKSGRRKGLKNTTFKGSKRTGGAVVSQGGKRYCNRAVLAQAYQVLADGGVVEQKRVRSARQC